MEDSAHWRRCHLCEAVTVSKKDPVEKCVNCGKVFAPFYYFDDCQTAVFEDDGIREPLREGEYRSLRGLSAFWKNF